MGIPHVTSMRFCVLGKKLYLRTRDYKVKAGLAKEEKVCFTQDEGSRYVGLRGVVIWGASEGDNGRGTRQEGREGHKDEVQRPEWKSSEMPAWWVQEKKVERRTYIEITPEKMSSWHNSKTS